MTSVATLILDDDRGIHLAEALVWCRRHGAPVSRSTLNNWIRRGIQSPYGPVRLRAAKMGGRWVTSPAALKRFYASFVAPTCFVPAPTTPTPDAAGVETKTPAGG
jgi:hypothetical protein